MKIVVFGGAGFIGTNFCLSALDQGHKLICVDDLSRPGSEDNLEKIERNAHAQQFEFKQLNIAIDGIEINEMMSRNRDVELVLNLAAQVAVTLSIVSPMNDFETNVRGNFNILESLRLNRYKGKYIFASTNKVYGCSPIVGVNGVSESSPLQFATPYGCSKGAADQYTLDYAKTFGLNTTVLRQSCIYGEHQHGIEDQGWFAHFAIKAWRDEPITIYGDGKQVRDLLYVEDLVDLYWRVASSESTNGQAYNVGGGLYNVMDLNGCVSMLNDILHKNTPIKYSEVRNGDQPIFISDNSKIIEATGWRPTTSIIRGFRLMYDWIVHNLD